MKDELKDLLELNKDTLDLQSFKQSVLFWEWAQKKVNAIEKRDKLKEHLAVTTAQISADIRKNPKKYGAEDTKITEGFVNAQLTINEELQNINISLIEAQKEVNYYSAAEQAIDNLGKRLDTASRLYTSGYFSQNTGKVFKEEAINQAMINQEEYLNSPEEKEVLSSTDKIKKRKLK